MAKRQSAKTNSGERNSERRNGKAFKKNPGPSQPGFRGHNMRMQRLASREEKPMQNRNELDHVIKRVGEHEILVCDHPNGYIHCTEKNRGVEFKRFDNGKWVIAGERE